MKVLLNYDPATTQITDNNGTLIGTWVGLESHEHKEATVSMVDELIKLKNAGYTTEEIIELRRKDLI